ncbi:MAG: hypothetical protein M3530_00665 [Thermoproteota archaeon]|jgi:hypothetical protein|nr:hypothetical protein [Thermoproteota archaeon]
MSDNNFQLLCDNVFSLSPSIRFAGVITKMGTLISGGMRHGLESLENKDDSLTLFVQFALRSRLGKDYDHVFGKSIYNLTEREKIKLASFPLDDNHILRISVMKEEKNHTQIIQNILEIIPKLQSR